MQKTEFEFVSRITFTEQTPDMLLEKTKTQPLYERAFLSSAEVPCSEYSQNTTSWD